MKTIRSEIEELLLLLEDHCLFDIVADIEEGGTSERDFEKYSKIISAGSFTHIEEDQINKILTELLWLITIE